MDVQLTRIQRWVDRLRETCRTGSWSSAVAEAECLEAEVRGAREQIWARLEAEALGELPRPWERFRGFLQGFALSLAVLLGVALPLSLEADRPMDFSTPLARGDLEWVSPDEQQLLQTLRRRLSEEGAGRRPAGIPKAFALSAPEPPGIPRPAKESSGRERPVAGTGTAGTTIADESARSRRQGGALPLEEVLALLQVGQRALREETPPRSEP